MSRTISARCRPRSRTGRAGWRLPKMFIARQILNRPPTRLPMKPGGCSTPIARASRFGTEASARFGRSAARNRFDNRGNVVKRLRAVTTAAVRSATPLWLTGDTSALPPNVANLVNNYLDEAHSRTLAVIPLEEYQPPSSTVTVKRARPKRKRKLGALVIEYFDREVPREAHEEDLQLVIDEGSVALTNALETNDILFLPLLRWLGA